MQKKAEETVRSAPRLWTPLFVLVIFLSFAISAVSQGLNTGITVYVELMGSSSLFAGFLAAVFSAAAAATRLTAGLLVDNRGRMTVLRAGMVCMAIGTLLPVALQDGFGLILGRMLQGIGFSAAATAAATAAADVLSEARLGEGIGFFGLGHALSTSVGPAFGLMLVAMDPAESLFFVLAAAAVCILVLTTLCRYEKDPSSLPETSGYRRRVENAMNDKSFSVDYNRKGSKQEKVSLFEPRALPGAVPMAALSAGFGFNVFFAGAYGADLGLEAVGGFFTCSAIAMIIVRVESNAFMERTLPIKAFAAAVLAAVMSFALLLLAPYLSWSFYIAGFFYGISNGIALPLNQSISVRSTPPERWGAANALYNLTFDVGIGLACVAWGALNDMLGYGASIVCAALCALVSLVLAWVVYPENAKRASLQ